MEDADIPLKADVERFTTTDYSLDQISRRYKAAQGRRLLTVPGREDEWHQIMDARKVKRRLKAGTWSLWKSPSKATSGASCQPTGRRRDTRSILIN